MKVNCNVLCDLLKFGQCLEIAVNRESNLCMSIKFSSSGVKFFTQQLIKICDFIG